MRFRLHQRYFLTILCLVTIGMAAVSAALLLHYEGSITQMKEATSRAYADGLAQQFEHRAHGLGLVTSSRCFIKHKAVSHRTVGRRTLSDARCRSIV
jgi:hypothetical protein